MTEASPASAPGATVPLFPELVLPLQISEATLPPGQYAVVEQLGHAKFVGRFEQVEAFGAQFLKIQPLFGEWMLPAVLLGGASLYRFTPCTPATAWAMRARYRHELPSSVCAQIPDEPDPVFAPAFLGYDQDEEDGRHDSN